MKQNFNPAEAWQKAMANNFKDKPKLQDILCKHVKRWKSKK